MPAMRMPIAGIRPLTGRQQQAVNRGQSALQATRPVQAPARVTLPTPGGFGAKTSAPIARPMPAPAPMPGPGKGSAPSMLPPAQPPMFNLPAPVQAQPMTPPPASLFQPPPGPQNPIGGFQTPPPAQNPPISSGNFGTIQSGPYPVSDVAMPTPNPVPTAPPPQIPTGGGMTPPGMPSIGFGPAPIDGGMMTVRHHHAEQVAQQQGGMMALPGAGSPISGAQQQSPGEQAYQNWATQQWNPGVYNQNPAGYATNLQSQWNQLSPAQQMSYV